LDGDGSVGALDRSVCWNNRNLSVQKPALMASPNNGTKIEDLKQNSDLKSGKKANKTESDYNNNSKTKKTR
jgi:hypothetical protein